MLTERFLIYTALKSRAIENESNIALLSDNEDNISWTSLLNKIDSITEDLLNLGFNHEDRIATSMANSSSAAIAALAIMSNFCLVPLDPGLQENEARERLIMARAKGLLVREGANTFACAASSELGLPIVIMEKESHDIHLLHKENHLSLEENPHSRSVRRLILFTSGTTSTPKVVPLSEKKFNFIFD